MTGLALVLQQAGGNGDMDYDAVSRVVEVVDDILAQVPAAPSYHHHRCCCCCNCFDPWQRSIYCGARKHLRPTTQPGSDDRELLAGGCGDSASAP